MNPRLRPRPFRAALTLASALVLVGCSSGTPTPETEPSEPAQTDSAEEDPEPVEPDEPGDAEVQITEFEVDEAVYFSGIEYRYGSLTVTDLDEEAGRQEGDPRLHGLRLSFDVDAYNQYDESVVPDAPMSLRWEEPGTQNIAEVPGRTEFNQVPGDSFTTGEVAFDVAPDHLETYDPDSAHVVFGTGGQTNAVQPLGGDAELVTLFPVVQDHLVGEQLDTDHVLFTFDNVEVRWNFGTSNQGQAEEGTAIVVFEMTGENTTDSNLCGRRSAGKSMFLKTSDGQGYVDEGVSERCFAPGETTRTVTGFVVDADYEGTYTVEYDFDPTGSRVAKGEIEIDLVSGEGLAPSASD